MAGAAEATIVRRMVARGIEGVVLVGPFLLVVLLPELYTAAKQQRPPEVDDLLIVIGLVSQTGLFVLEVVLVVLAGGSFGKLLLGLRVETVDGGRPSWRQAAVRTAVYAAFPLSLLLLVLPRGAPLASLWNLALLFSIVQPEDRRGWHDRWSDTLVVRRA